MFSEMKDLFAKRHAGTATQAELDRIEEIKALREDRLKRVADLQESLGLNALAKEANEIRAEKEALRVASDEAWAREGAEKENKAIEKSGLSAPEYFRKKALKAFKTTTNFNEAGYLLPDGKLLNFSGGERNHRYRDHREIGEIYEATQGTAALNRFLNDGNIRIMAESPGIDLSSGVEPTNEQYAAIKRFVNSNGVKDGQFFVDFSDADGHSAGNYSYEGKVNADRVVNDIKYFFQNGKVREASSIAGFLYSSQETDLDSKANPYSYNTLVSKPDMVVTTVSSNIPKNRADVVYQAKQNAAKVGAIDPKTGSVSVHVDDVGTDVLLGTEGLKHGLRRTKDAQNDANYIVTLKAGEIIKNSIKINETNPKKQNATGSYVLIGAATNTSGDLYIVRSVVNQFKNELAAMDVLYAINAKKELAATKSPRSMAKPLSETSSTISIAELLDLVNQYFPDVLPEDVLKHYGYDARPEGDLGDGMLYSEHDTDYSNRSLLANAFEGITQNSEEYKLIQKYKGHIKDLNALDKALGKINAEIREIRFTKGKYDAKKLSELETKGKAIAGEITRHDKELLSLEASEPLRKVLERERKKEAQKTKAHVKEIRQKMKESAAVKEKRAVAEKAAKALMDMLAHPTKDAHVPTALQKPLQEFLESIDFSSQTQLAGKGMTIRDVA